MNRILVLLLFLMVFPAACTRPVSTLPVKAPPVSPVSVEIEQVQVSQNSGIFVQGKTSLPDGNCVMTELRAGGQAEDWWPKELCVEAADGQWELLVPLGKRGAPGELQDGIEYEMRAWWPEDEQATTAVFPFDLSAPPQP